MAITEDKIESLLKDFRKAVRPPLKLSPSDWAHDRVALYEGKSPKYDKTATPWMVEPLDEFSNTETNEIIILSPIGSGKTTMLEAAIAYIVAEDPSPTLVVGQTNNTIEEWFETRLEHTLQNTPECKVFLPTGKHKNNKKKDSILFQHMQLRSTGANVSGLQARSMRRVICDEPWTYKKGMIRQSEGRLHDRWNRQWIGVSQGGSVNDDWHGKWDNCNQYEYMWKCPCCGTRQPFSWTSVIYDEDPTNDINTAKSARMKCANSECEFIVTDNSKDRRAITETSKYIKIKDGLPNTKGFHFNILANWSVPLWRLVLERMKAMEEVSRGNLELLKQFIQKRLAEFWQESQEDNRITLDGGGYSYRDYINGEVWEDETFRFMTIDRQQDHFWVGIRAWSKDGRSRLLFYSKVDTWEELEKIRIQYNVEQRKTQIDCGFQKDEVYKRCAQYGWLALRGEQRNDFIHHGRNGTRVFKPYSTYQNVQASNGKITKMAFFSNLVMKDILFQLRNRKGLSWEIMDDAPKDYIQQIDAEVRRGEGKTAIWHKRSNNNHAVDVETMQISMACMLGILGVQVLPDVAELDETGE